jgi:hypothetical protein
MEWAHRAQCNPALGNAIFASRKASFWVVNRRIDPGRDCGGGLAYPVLAPDSTLDRPGDDAHIAFIICTSSRFSI